MGNKIIKIFLASSSELKDDREQFEIFINRKNKEYIKQGIFLHLELWEDFLYAMSPTRLQDEYNKAITDCLVFVSLFHTKVGQYTEEEFLKALATFKDQQKPLIYTYFKDSPIHISKITNEITSLLNFKEKLDKLGHFYKPYKDIDQLQYLFDQQLNKFIPELVGKIEADFPPELEQSLRSQISQLEQQLEQEQSQYESSIKQAQDELAKKEAENTQLLEKISRLNQQLQSIKKVNLTKEIELKSERGVNYTKLHDLLAAGNWEEADQETNKVMCMAAGRESEGCLDKESINNFPCEDLRTINQLWLHYSKGKFGFSVQKQIYDSLDGTREYNREVWEKFGDRVGWREEGNWKSCSYLTFDLGLALPGHLPVVSWVGGAAGMFVFGLFFFSRAKTCNL